MRDVIKPDGTTETRGVSLSAKSEPLLFALRREAAWLDERWRIEWQAPRRG